LKLLPDLSTLTVVPWEEDPTAAVICDLVHQDGRSVEFTPRNVLKRVLAAYDERGLTPVVAPEIEFYLVRKNPDPDYPLTPPVGRSGRPIGGGAGYSIAGVNEFDDPIELADQVFMFKRTIREAALKHEIYATFMAKPIQGQPGSAMHIHQSVLDKKTGKNIFSAEDGSETDAFFHFIGGMQKHVPNALVMFAPYVNSYRRLTQAASAPVNTKWGYDNRTTAFRVPRSDPAARRVENRIPSSDANPYLALAASLACGLIGITRKEKASAPVLTTANEDEIDLPRNLLEAVDLFEADKELGAILGKSFAATYAAIKRAEFETFMEVISPWEREYLLLNV
ncbi:MAG: glutamine synthetase, partial [Mesorhizobium sp.]